MKTSNIVLGLLVTGAAVLVGRYLYKNYRKEKTVLTKKKEEKKAEIINLGLNPEKFEEEISEDFDAQNLPKQLFHAIRFGKDWDLEVLYGNKKEPIYDCQNPIFVMQSEWGHEKFLDLYFAIPMIEENEVIDRGSDKRFQKRKRINLNPRVNDYVNAINDCLSEVCDDLKFVDNPDTKWCGFAVVTYQSKDEKGNIVEEQNVFELQREFYSGWNEEEKPYRALTAFVNDWKLERPEADELINTEMSKYLEERGLTLSEVKDIFLCYKASFKMADLTITGKADNFGINLPLGVRALKMITDNLMVYYGYFNEDTESSRQDKMRNSKIVMYNRLIFCAPDENEQWNISLNYDVNDKGHICVTLMEYN